MVAAQIQVLRGENPANPLWRYVGEILAIEGFCFDWVDTPSGPRALLIIPNLLLTPAQQDIVREHARRGGSMIAFRPAVELASVFGIEPYGESWMFEGRRLVGQWWSAYTRHPEGELLQVHGGADLYRVSGAEEIAPLLSDYDADLPGRRHAGSLHPAVSRVEASGGRRVCFAYDLARCVALIQQGRADQASDGPFANADGDAKFSLNDMFIGHLDPRLRNVPQSDLHRDLLVRMIDWAVEREKPVPRLWRFPGAQVTAAMIDGDGDMAPRAEFDLAFSTCKEFGFPYSTYLMADQFEAIAPSEAGSLRAEGHSVGFHPWCGAFPSPSEFEVYLKKAFGDFSNRYGYVPSATRNHCVIWTGWVDTARVEAEIGIRMDLNGYSCAYFQSGAQTGTLLPVKFIDQRGAMLDIYSQFTIISDDAWIDDKTYLPRLSERERIEESRRWIERCIRHQGMFHPTFHPIRLRRYGEPTLPWLRETLACLQSHKVRGWSADGWTAFNDARRAIRIESVESGWIVKTNQAVRETTLLLPEGVGEQILLDGTAVKGQPFYTAGRGQMAFVVDLEAGHSGKLEIPPAL
ncbi:MAG: hypothetical protein HY360_12275 [Verrucomicrobia bacterium]|nr:hypothetical protein [Verrucomicrobiota bacterium]